MGIETLIEAVRLCGSTPKVDQCKQCAYWSGGDMSKCIPRMTTDAATALSTLQAENEQLRAELEQMDACIYYKAGGLCRYGGDDPGNVCVFGPCPQEVSSQDILAELEQVKLAARNDIPHNCHTCMDKSNPTCPGNKRTNSFGYQENCEKWTWRGPQKED